MAACDLVYIVRILLLEQAVGLRKTLTAHRTGVARYEVGTCLNYIGFWDTTVSLKHFDVKHLFGPSLRQGPQGTPGET